MDSRTKILPAEEIVRRTAGRDVIWLRGRFDPLLAYQAGKIEASKKPGTVLVAVLDDEGERPLLAARARAELAAALRAVDYVAVGDAPAGTETVSLGDEDARLAFMRRVRQRCGAAD